MSGPRVRGTSVEPLRVGRILPVLLVWLALGTLFGAAEVTTVAFSTQHGHRGLARVLLAL